MQQLNVQAYNTKTEKYESELNIYHFILFINQKFLQP